MTQTNGKPKTTSVIEICGTGGILVQRTFEVPEGGGVTVLKGQNGTGKSTVQQAARDLLTGNSSLEHHDNVEKGKVSGFGRTLNIAKRRSWAGKSNELEVTHIEDRYDLGLFIDPGMKTPESNDSVRLKQLVRMSGKTIDFAEFEKLKPACPDPELPTPDLSAARAEPDPVSQSTKARLTFQEVARQVEKAEAAERKRQEQCEAKSAGVDLSVKTDDAADRQAHRDALTELLRLQETAKSAQQAIAARDKATGELSRLEAEYTGPSQEDAQAGLSAAQKRESAALEALEKAKAELAASRQAVETASLTLESANRHEDMVSRFRQILNSPVPEEPNEDDLAAAEEVVQQSESQISENSDLRKRQDEQRKANAFKAGADRMKAYAEALRKAAAKSDEVLGRCIQFDDLRWIGGRLLFTGEIDGEKREEMLDRLSPGLRTYIGMQICAQGVSQEAGDGTNLIVLDQQYWQDLDPDRRDYLHDLAVSLGVNVLAAECSRGPLRAVLHGQEDPWEAEKQSAV